MASTLLAEKHLLPCSKGVPLACAGQCLPVPGQEPQSLVAVCFILYLQSTSLRIKFKILMTHKNSKVI